MRNTVLAAAISAGALACVLSSADAGTLIPVPQVPGSSATTIVGINDANVVTGSYTDSGGLTHGFVGPVSGGYTLFDVRDGNTLAFDLNNDGYVTAFSSNSAAEYVRAPDGSFATITKAGSPLIGVPGAIAAHQRFVGYYFSTDGTGTQLGYVGRGTKYRYDLTLPFTSVGTAPRGLNKAGTIVGHFLSKAGEGEKGFILKDGVATAVQYPDSAAHDTYLYGINDRGLVSGEWKNSDGTAWHAFLYDQQAAAFSPIDVPGATQVFARYVNRGGVVAVEADGLSYIYCTRKKTCPLGPAKGISIPEKWIRAPAANIRTVLCKNGCRGPLHEPARVKPADVAAMRATVARDLELQFEWHSSHGQ